MKYKSWNRTLWKQAIDNLPAGLTVKAAARKLNREYEITLLWLNRYNYPLNDQRGVASARIMLKRRKVDPAKVDWTQRDASLARKYDVSLERMRQIRNAQRQPKVNGRK